MNEDKPQLASDHDYDGIQEYDNPLPVWWLVTFFATIIFGFHYALYYEAGGGGLTQKQELTADLEAIKQRAPPESGVTEPAMAETAKSPQALLEGQAVFSGKCAVCHGQQLEGGIGPNLVDEFWLHGKGSAEDIVAVVRSGVPDKGMPNWEAMLKGPEIRAVAAFIWSKRGSHPPNARPPQGEKIAPN